MLPNYFFSKFYTCVYR